MGRPLSSVQMGEVVSFNEMNRRYSSMFTVEIQHICNAIRVDVTSIGGDEGGKETLYFTKTQEGWERVEEIPEIEDIE